LRTLVLGLGNPILSDDSVGFRVAQLLRSQLDQREVTVLETGVAGLNLLDLLVGYDKAVIIDAIQTVEGKAGDVYRLDPRDFDQTGRTLSSHGLNFATTLTLDKKLGLALPQRIIIFAIEIEDTSTFSEQCTPEVEKALPAIVDMVIRELDSA
jgi:hydrogenase maturation protease